MTLNGHYKMFFHCMMGYLCMWIPNRENLLEKTAVVSHDTDT